MKKARTIPVVLAALLVTVTALAGCGVGKTTTGGDQYVESAKREEVTAAAGSEFQVVLDANPTTGYEWAIVNTPDAKVVQSKGSYMLQSPESSGMMGAPSRQVWKFLAVGQGKTDVMFENRQAGQQGGTPAQTHDVAVTVEAPQAKPPMPRVFKSSPVSVKAGQDFFITMKSQAGSTGYIWKLGSGYDRKVVTFRGSAYSKQGSSTPGAPVEEMWRFGAVGKGSTRLVFGLVRPWEENAKASKAVVFEVNVK